MFWIVSEACRWHDATERKGTRARDLFCEIADLDDMKLALKLLLGKLERSQAPETMRNAGQ